MVKNILDILIDVLVNNSKIKIELRGYSNRTDSANYNLMLSKQRSLSVENYLIEKGIDPIRIKSIAPEWILHWETIIRKKAEPKSEELALFYSKNK